MPGRHDTTPWAPRIALAAVVLLGAVLRSERIGSDAVSLDEMWHLGLSTGRGSPQMVWPADKLIHVEQSWTETAGAPPWYACWTHMERVLHPPLFVMTLRLWRDLFGSGDVAAQWYTASWSLAAVVLVFAIARTLSRSTAAGLWAAAILAVAPTQILLSQELRAYSMLTGLTCCAMLAAARMEMHGVTSRRVAALAIAMLAMMLTHYFAVGVCAMIATWACIRFRGRPLAALWIGFLAAGAVFAATWMPIALRQIPDIGHTADPWLKEPASQPYLLAIGRFFSMPVRLLVDQEYAGFIWPAIGAAFLGFALVRARRLPELLLPFLCFAGVCVFLLLLDLARVTRHLVYIRYSLAAGPAVAVLAVLVWRVRTIADSTEPAEVGRDVAAALSDAPGQTPIAGGRRVAIAMHGVAAVIVSLLLLTSDRAYFADEPDYRVLRRFMLEHASTTEPMVFYSGPAVKGYFNEILMLAASREPALWPRNVVKLASPADAPLIESLGRGTAWLFSGPVDDLNRLLPGCAVLSQQTLLDADDRPVAVCTHVRLPG